ncbi:hypothetical protein KCU67_g37, partial [Aureobasidium melanogenum]
LCSKRGCTPYESRWPSSPAKFGPTVRRTAMLPHFSFIPADDQLYQVQKQCERSFLGAPYGAIRRCL